MKIESLPEFAKPYKTKGYDVRFQHGTYMLFKISSKRVPDKSYPVLIQEFIGIIDEDKGLIPKKEYKDTKVEYVEYGLSNFIYTRFHRMLTRETFNGPNENDILLAVNKYIFGDVNNVTLSKCYMTKNKIDELQTRYQEIHQSRITKLVNKIKFEMQILFDQDLFEFELLMKYVVVEANKDYVTPYYGEQIIEIARKHKVKII